MARRVNVFPLPADSFTDEEGLELRDLFAAAALVLIAPAYGTLVHDGPDLSGIEPEAAWRRVAFEAYGIADALLAEREATR